MSLRRIFVANRGEIAVRIIRACQEAGLETVLGVSQADQDSMAARMADRAICIGPASSGDSYLNIDAIVTAAVGTQCDGLHPGYGFLAENGGLADLCAEHGVTFIGPKSETIRRLGDKIKARALAKSAGIPVVPGRDEVTNYEEAEAAADSIGFPILLKAAAGGGGRGMQVVRANDRLKSAFDTARAEAKAAFGDDTVYMERFIGSARHVEVQILGDCHGNVIHLGERDCTLQRRHQKIIEEGPATALPADLVDNMRRAAVDLARSVGYEGAGTVEFIVDQDEDEFFFLEVNTRIQVEHPVTEMITGIDLVAQQLKIAAGKRIEFKQEQVRLEGHAIECRINAEAASESFRPSPGQIAEWHAPELSDVIRLDTHCYSGYTVPPFYDSMLAKLIVTGTDRNDALKRMSRALATFRISGIETTLPFLKAIIERPEFQSEQVSTRWVETLFDDPDFVARLERTQQ